MQRSIIAPAERVTNLRWGIALVVALGELAFQLGTGSGTIGGTAAVTLAVVVAVAAVPLGMTVDRAGVRPVAVAACILFALVAALAPYLGSRTATATLGGLAAAAIGPVEFAAMARWFPRSETPRAWAIVVAASLAGVALGAMLHTGGWIVAAPAALAAALYAGVYREPREGVRGVTYAERTYLERGGALPAEVPAGPNLRVVAGSVPIWLCAFGFGSLAYGLAFNLAVLVHAASAPLLAGASLVGAFIVTTLGWTAAARHAPRGASGTTGGVFLLASTLGYLLAAAIGVDAPGAGIADVIALVLFALALRRRA